MQYIFTALLFAFALYGVIVFCKAIDLLEFILAKNRLDVTNKIMDDLSKILSNHDQSGLK